MKDNVEFGTKAAEQLPQIEKSVAGKVWLIIIWTFAIVLVFSVIVLGLSVFIPPATGGTTGQIILTVITTVIGFLAGLFSPSPVEKANPPSSG
jgi:hypothetical protein